MQLNKKEEQGNVKTLFLCSHFVYISFFVYVLNEPLLYFKYSSIADAAVFPAPIADMTVAAPVTASPPA